MREFAIARWSRFRSGGCRELRVIGQHVRQERAGHLGWAFPGPFPPTNWTRTKTRSALLSASQGVSLLFTLSKKGKGGAFFFYFWTATRTSVASFWFGCIVPQPVVADYLFVLQRYGGLFFFLLLLFFFSLSGRRDLAYFEAFCRVQYFFYFLF